VQIDCLGVLAGSPGQVKDSDEESIEELLPEMGTSCIDCEEEVDQPPVRWDIPFVGWSPLQKTPIRAGS